MKKALSCGGIVLNSAGDVALVLEQNAGWTFPKGKPEQGEDELSAARREIFEETGIASCALMQKLGTYECQKLKPTGEARNVLKTVTLFLFQAQDTPLRPHGRDISEARWIPQEQVPQLLAHPKDREFFLSVAALLQPNVNV